MISDHDWRQNKYKNIFYKWWVQRLINGGVSNHHDRYFTVLIW